MRKTPEQIEEAAIASQSQSSQSIWDGFSKLDFSARLKLLNQNHFIDSEDISFLKTGLNDISLAEKFIENVLGYFQMPFGVAPHFLIDEEPILVPMAVEETSIIAAASKTAKWVKEFGYIKTEVKGHSIIGQIQIAKVKNFNFLRQNILEKKEHWIKIANEDVAASMVKRGGGVLDIELRTIERPDKELMAIIHVYMNAIDAMGANIMNQVCEYLKTPIEEATGEKVTMCILSNLVDSKVTRAEITIDTKDSDLASRIEEASFFAECDPYRAATHNKGVMNGIDPIAVATGNDWRAIEAGMHAYACRSGQYRALTTWRKVGVTELKGVFEAPLIVGVVGGVTQLHPMAKLSLKILKNPDANRLSRIMSAVGLVQNLGALKALTTVGIIEGHMRLHIKNLSLGAGANEKELPFVAQKLEEILSIKKRISLTQAIEVLKELRLKKQ